ncbi:Peptidyl-prolyl cis-trans isomerase cyp6, partial [Rhizophlyctis rosea]
MSVLLETSLGDITIDLHYEKAPKAAENFLKLCKIKYYNFVLFHNVQKGFMAQAGDPTATGRGGESVWGLRVIHGASRRYFIPEIHPKLKHKTKGTVSFATAETNEAGLPVAGSQFFITLSDNHLDYLDGKQAVFGKVVEGLEVLDEINRAMCDDDGRPYRDIRIKHTIILDDPFDDPEGLVVPDRSPIPTADMLKTARIAEDEELVPDLPPEELERREREQEAAARAITLEMMGDLPFAEIKPPENVVFVCKLNPVTRDEDLEIIFSRFGTILSCEVIRDQKTGDSLCYAFIEFDNKESAEEAYFKMDNVLIDDRRIHVDFSQSVSKLHYDFMRGERRQLADGEGYGGSRGLERRRKYRDEDERHEDYDLVFEHGDDLDAEKQRVKRVK